MRRNHTRWTCYAVALREPQLLGFRPREHSRPLGAPYMCKVFMPWGATPLVAESVFHVVSRAQGTHPCLQGIGACSRTGPWETVEISIIIEARWEHDTSRVAQHRHVAGGAGEVAHLGSDA